MKTKALNSFNGFTPDSVKFFSELEKNNNKQWFEKNRQRYNDLNAVFTELVLSLNSTMTSIDPEFEIRPSRIISRIYRDMRFSREKIPYRTCVWITYKRPGANMNENPVYFFELSANLYRYGMGFYSASKGTMDAYRAMMIKDPAAFSAMAKAVEKKGFSAEGEMYKKRLDNDLPSGLQDWFQRRNLYFIKNCPVDETVFSPEIVKILAKDFKTLGPFYRFLWSIRPAK